MRAKELVFVFQRVLPHYRLENFNYLDTLLDSKLRVFFDSSIKSDSLILSGKGMKFKSGQLSTVPLLNGKVFWQRFLKALSIYGMPKAAILEGNPRLISNVFLALYFRLNGVKVIFWGQGNSSTVKSGKRTIGKNFQYLLIKLADAYITYTENGKEYVTQYCQRDKVFVARNTINIERISAARALLPSVEILKRKMGFQQDYYALFVGQLIDSKRVDIVISNVIKLYESGINLGCLIIGDGPKREELKSSIPQEYKDLFYFLGAIEDFEASAPYIFLSDFSLSPGGIGLAVNHCLALGVPLIVEKDYKVAMHGPEVEYLRDGENGFYVNYLDFESVRKSVLTIIKNREFYRENCIKYAEENLAMRNFGKGFMDCLSYLKVL